MSSFDPLGGLTRVAAANRRAKTPPKQRAVNDAKVMRAVRTVATTTKRTAPVAPRAARRIVRTAPPVDPVDAVIAQYQRSKAKQAKAPKTNTQTGGPNDLQRLLGATGGGGGWLGTAIRGGASDLLNIALSVPQQTQLIGENVLAFNPLSLPETGMELALGRSGLPGTGWMRSNQARAVKHDVAAAKGTAADYKQFYYDPLSRGDFGQFGSNVLHHPVRFGLDVAMLKGAIGHAPNLAPNIVTRVAPETMAAARARVKLSTQPLEARRWAHDVSTANRATKGKGPLPFVAEPGRRYRPPVERRSVIANPEPGRAPVAHIVDKVERPAYSADFIARARQKGVDRLRPVVGPKVRGVADRLQAGQLDQPGKIRGAAAAVTAPLRTEAKFARGKRAEVLQLGHEYTSRAEASAARTLAGGKQDTGLHVALARLRKDTGAAGIPIRQKISTEQMAVRLHWNDELAPRAGMSAPQLRDMVVRRAEGEIQKLRNAGRYDDARARQAQVEIVKRIPDELLTLTDMKNPAVKRVADAVTEGRRANAENQAKSVAAGVVTPETAAAMGARSSRITLGGSQWWQEAVHQVQRSMNPKIQGIRKRVNAARAAGNAAEAERLSKLLAERVAARNAKIAKIKEGATTVTPQLERARAEFRAADEALRAERAKVATRARLNKLFSAGRITGRGERNLELAPGQRLGRRRQPGQPTRNQDYLLRTRGGGRAEYEAKKFSASLSGGRHDPLVPHPPISPGEARPVGIGAGQGKAYRTILRGRAKQYEVRLKTEGASGAKISAATRARDTYMKRLRKQEVEHLGLTAPRRPELIGDQGVYIPDRNVRPGERPTGPRAQGIGPDVARQSKGRLKESMGYDAHPNLMMHQTARAANNYTGKMSNQAFNDLIDTIGYRIPGTKGPDGRELLLTGKRKAMENAAATGRAGFVNVKKFRAALKELDDLEPGKYLAKETVEGAFSDHLPAGANASDYIAVHADGLKVWRSAMFEPNKILRYADNSLTFWKGGLLALMPRWYINNTFGLALQYGLLAGPDIGSIVRGNRPEIRAAMEKRAPWAVKDTFARDNPGVTPRAIQRAFEVNSKLEEIWRRAAYMNRAKKLLGTEGVRYSRLTDVELAKALETMPESMVRSIVRDVNFFIGDYQKFSAVERNIIKRVVPFYSWLRVISKLTFALPFRSPLRSAAMQVLSKAAIAGIDPRFYELPWYMRPAFRFGNTRVVATSADPMATLGGPLAATGAPSPVGALLNEGYSWTHPGIGLINSLAFGTNAFGQGLIPAPGTAAFGQDPRAFNQVTGTVDSQPPNVGIGEALLQTITPAQVTLARKALPPAGMVALDTTSTHDLIADWVTRVNGGKGNDNLYRKVKTGGGLTPKTSRGWRVFGGLTGFNVYDQNDPAVTRDYRDKLRQQIALERKLAAKR